MLRTTHSQPLTPSTVARPVVSMVLTQPPPPEPGGPAAGVLALHRVGTAHAPGHLLTAAQLVHFGLPGHLGVSLVGCFKRALAGCFVPMHGRTGYTECEQGKGAGRWTKLPT